MKNLGLAYASKDVQVLLKPAENLILPNARLIGVIFGAGEQFPEEFDIRQVYFAPGNGSTGIRFFSRKAKIEKTGVYLENKEKNKLEYFKSGSLGKEKCGIEFADAFNFGFGFFTINELAILVALSENIIISGAQMNPGLLAYPDKDISYPNPPFATLIAEVDRRNMKKVYINPDLPSRYLAKSKEEVREAVPVYALALPCPPYWEADNKITELSTTLRRHRSRVVKGERWSKSMWIKEVNETWNDLALKLAVDLKSYRGGESKRKKRTKGGIVDFDLNSSN